MVNLTQRLRKLPDRKGLDRGWDREYSLTRFSSLKGVSDFYSTAGNATSLLRIR
ncbi:MAG: hypothetical protein F6K55_11420 [Moorea sp. SIO4A3]|nr:hypothetical protein [Moorena sp. SIO4A3]